MLLRCVLILLSPAAAMSDGDASHQSFLMTPIADGHAFVGWLTSLEAAEHCRRLLQEQRISLVYDLDDTLIYAQHVPPAALAW